MERTIAEFSMRPHVSESRNIYNLTIACDNDGHDYCESECECPEAEMDKLLILMIAYLNLNFDNMPDNRRKHLSDEDESFGGMQVAQNVRFDTDMVEGWLGGYAEEHNLLAYNDYCNVCFDIDRINVLGINVVYFDGEDNMMDCTCPDLGAMFETEAEFIEYVHELAGFE